MDNDTTEIEIPPGAHRLPSGGWVALTDERSHSARDVHYLRKALDERGAGSVGNELLKRAVQLRVQRWEIPGRPNLPLPHGNETWLALVGWEDMEALEDLVGPWAERLGLGKRPEAPKPNGESGEPGSEAGNE